MPSRSHVGKGSERPLRRRKGISVTRQGNEVLLGLKRKHPSREERTKDRDSNGVQNRVCCTSRWSAEGNQAVSLGSCFPNLCRVKQRMDKYEYCTRTGREFSKSKRKWFGSGNGREGDGGISCQKVFPLVMRTHWCGWTLPAWGCLERGRTSSLAEKRQTSSISWKK